MSEIVASPVQNWVPYQLKSDQKGYTCKWLYCSNEEYTEPFFIETMLKCKGHPYNSKDFSSSARIEMLSEWAGTLNAVKPAAFIFHISRCGSTLLSQALGINDEHIVLSEVPFIDELLQLSDSDLWPVDLDRQATLKAAFDFYGQNRSGKKKHVFVKTDCWHIYFVKQLRELYPDIPFVMLYRRPDEVIRSQQKRRGIQAVPGLIPNHILGIKEASFINLDQHMAKVIESFLTAMVKWVEEDQLTMLVNYNEGVEEIVKRLAVFTGIELEEEYLQEVSIRSKYDAKQPGQVFGAEELMDHIPAYLEPAFRVYDELEAVRIRAMKGIKF